MLGLILAFVFAFVAVSQVNALQDISKTVTTGAVNDLFGISTFIMLLLAVVVGLFVIGGMVMWALRH